MILIYDKLENHDGEVTKVLCVDGHVLTADRDALMICIEMDNKLRRKLGLTEKALGE